MDFKVMQLTMAENFTKKEREFAEYLRNSPIGLEGNLEYGISNDVLLEDHIIVGCLTEEYNPRQFTMDQNKTVIPITNIDPFERTFFALDFATRMLLVEFREYPPDELDREQALQRLTSYLTRAFDSIYRVQFNYMNTIQPHTDDYFSHFIENFPVTMIRVKLGEVGRLLPRQNEVFIDPTLALNWADGWNEDDSRTYEYIVKAKKDGDLKSSPTVRTLLQLPGKEIQEIKYIDENNRIRHIQRNKFERFEIANLNTNGDNITIYNTILTYIRNNRDHLRTFRAITAPGFVE